MCRYLYCNSEDSLVDAACSQPNSWGMFIWKRGILIAYQLEHVLVDSLLKLCLSKWEARVLGTGALDVFRVWRAVDSEWVSMLGQSDHRPKNSRGS
ncbi:hypothetical protein ElyMa_006384900 [Elysia marginata]|uniref:Uncharacterized protein n=1 Tax=Elysia marginata TaxID=1093978 RepID=A0AAV4HQZ0_9GAST|nr:hypothetical protein ElyMa_006384900 [Elysia marginata]